MIPLGRSRLVMTAVLGITMMGPGAATQKRFRSSADAVLVDVHVTRDGRPVTGLTAKDFELRDSGVRQVIEVVSMADVPINLLVAMDLSASVEGERLAQLKRAATDAIDPLRPGDQAAILTFSDRIALRSDWTPDRALLRKRIDDLQAGGWTALYDAVFSAIARSHTAAGRVVVLVFSDGADTSSWLDAKAVLESVRRSDVVITAVSAAPHAAAARGAADARRSFGLEAALRRRFDEDPVLFPYAFLDALTRDAGGHLLRVRAEGEIAAAFRQIVEDFKTRYLLTYSPRDVPPDGWHPLEVRVTTRGGEVRARRGYWR